MSVRPLLGSVDCSSRYEATSSRGSDDGPTLPLDEIDRPIVEKRLLLLVYIMNIMDRYNVALLPYDLKPHEEAIIIPLELHDSMGCYYRCSWISCRSYFALFIGFAEAAFFPGAVFPSFTMKNELGLRTALLFCGSSISNAFGALIASGILGSLDGGSSLWKGALTIVVAVSAIWILPDFPSTPSVWLSPDEQTLAKRRMEEEILAIGHEGKPEENFSALAEALVDWRSFFSRPYPATMGYSATTSLLLCAPPWILGTATSFVVARHSDVTGDRFWHIVCPLLLGIAGFTDGNFYNEYSRAISIFFSDSTSLRAPRRFFMAQSSVAYVVCLTWAMNTFSQSQSKRAAAIALVNTMAVAGFISSSYFWPSSWGPSYVNSYLICILANVLCIAMCWVFKGAPFPLFEKLMSVAHELEDGTINADEAVGWTDEARRYTKEEIHDAYPSTRRLFVIVTAVTNEQERRMAGKWTETTEPFALSLFRRKVIGRNDDEWEWAKLQSSPLEKYQFG
ncbi:major facilitator superfamily domain-containing protein [Suillus subalutaceus]|uniref:major facilitator superfamily domain-containing protein n=1 Tax=Suillus subalutaceus TaxID=48586 RepID=UPI001B874C7C|nr:major facilitator superfamily domain-containing protein [Suillus subalutaceus]KAG1845707.1 major facilitator superfamily domain-containing protein [Suillus subalutaceus]